MQIPKDLIRRSLEVFFVSGIIFSDSLLRRQEDCRWMDLFLFWDFWFILVLMGVYSWQRPILHMMMPLYISRYQNNLFWQKHIAEQRVVVKRKRSSFELLWSSCSLSWLPAWLYTLLQRLKQYHNRFASNFLSSNIFPAGYWYWSDKLHERFSGHS